MTTPCKIVYDLPNNKVICKIECPFCGREYMVKVSRKGWVDYTVNNKLAQDCFPELSPAERELLISGTCNQCWEDLYGGFEDE